VDGTVAGSTPLIYAPDCSVSSFTDFFQVGSKDRVSMGDSLSDFSLDEVAVWARALSDAEVDSLWADGGGETYPFLGGAFNRVFQGRLINDPPKPLVLGSDRSLLAVTQLYDGVAEEFQAKLDLLFSGSRATEGYPWAADNFYDKILFAQHDNRAQYWTPPLPALAYDLPGLPSDDAAWDGVAAFAGHVLLWKEDRLKWSDRDDFTLYIPVAQTAISTALTLGQAFKQPAPGGSVAVTVTNPIAAVGSVNLSGDASFGSIPVGTTSQGVLTITNTGTAPVNVKNVQLPAGFSGTFSTPDGTNVVPPGQAFPMTVTFNPPLGAGGTFGGNAHIYSDATEGTWDFYISGVGISTAPHVVLSGVLDFGPVKADSHNYSLTSALIIQNTGNAPLHVTGLTMPASVFSGNWVGTVPAMSGSGVPGQQIVNVTFTPGKTVAEYSGVITVKVASSDHASGVLTIGASGSGISSFSKSAIFVTDMGTCQFGPRVAGSYTGTLRVYNPTSFAFQVIGIAHPDGFTTSYATPTVIPTFGHADFTVTYSAAAGVAAAGSLTVSVNHPAPGLNTCGVSGTGIASGSALTLSGNLNFGDTPVGGSAQASLTIKNSGSTTVNITSISFDTSLAGAVSGTLAGPIAPGVSQTVAIAFRPTTTSTYTGNLTVNTVETITGNVFPVSGTGFNLSQPLALVADQVVSLEDTRDGRTYYNFYTVVSMADTALTLTLMDLTGGTPAGLSIPADGRQFFTVDANEAGETRVVGAGMNGPIFQVVPQGDYAYIFKERSIQSVQYTGLGSGTFFVHNEVSNEGLIGREALCERGDAIVFLGHRELYIYQGGPSPVPVCQQTTRELFTELDRSRAGAIRLFHNESRKEVWVKYPTLGGGFRVLVWNYVEDSATFDDYKPAVEFTGLGLVDWPTDDATGSAIERICVLGNADGNLRVHGRVYSRDGAGYLAASETMDFDLGEPDIWKYVDVVVLGLEVKAPETASRYMAVQIGTRASLSGYSNAPDEDGSITWTAPQQVLVNGHAPVPVKVNPGGAGRYLRVRFSSSDPGVQWRVSSFEVHCRPGGYY
jgi:hypothetical protein